MARKIKIDNAILKRRQHSAPKRKVRVINCNILIVCEGEKTEPNYFRVFNKTRKGTIVYELTIDGGGINTMQVVDKAIELNSSFDYDSVWAVFDKDSFSPDQFNGAIIKARQNNINCAWSNEAFELWYLLHFHNRVTAMSREEYKKAISDAVNTSPKNKKKKKDYEYAKNAPNNYDIINQYGNQNAAIRWVKSLHDQFEDQRFHTHNPCTLVYKLVLQLIGEDDDLNSKLISKIES